jgi:hypothetical protein
VVHLLLITLKKNVVWASAERNFCDFSGKIFVFCPRKMKWNTSVIVLRNKLGIFEMDELLIGKIVQSYRFSLFRLEPCFLSIKEKCDIDLAYARSSILWRLPFQRKTNSPLFSEMKFPN